MAKQKENKFEGYQSKEIVQMLKLFEKIGKTELPEGEGVILIAVNKDRNSKCLALNQRAEGTFILIQLIGDIRKRLISDIRKRLMNSILRSIGDEESDGED